MKKEKKNSAEKDIQQLIVSIEKSISDITGIQMITSPSQYNRLLKYEQLEKFYSTPVGAMIKD